MADLPAWVASDGTWIDIGEDVVAVWLNAVFDAVGYRAHSLPIRPEHVFEHLRKMKKAPGGWTKSWQK